jgi:uncharacterized protein (TIGR02246 family)
VIFFVDKDQKKSSPFTQPMDTPVENADMEELYRRIRPEMRRAKPSADAIAAAMESAQRLAAEMDTEDVADDLARDVAADSEAVCGVCGHHNRVGTKFCAMCGVAVDSNNLTASATTKSGATTSAIALPQAPFPAPEMRPPTAGPTGHETHHYHHHYHHHYFPGAEQGMVPRPVGEVVREPARELRPAAAALRGEMSRAEAAVRAITQEWMMACNTKHLDDLLELYNSDALVLRSNTPPIRGAAAVREFFFGALDAGLGEVDLDPIRVDVVGDFAYEAGRCKALIPGSAGKRREERGKYLWVLARQTNNDWKLTADCWSSDLTLSNLESDVPTGAGIKTSQPRKNP